MLENEMSAKENDLYNAIMGLINDVDEEYRDGLVGEILTLMYLFFKEKDLVT